jgi:hypothetical protein
VRLDRDCGRTQKQASVALSHTSRKRARTDTFVQVVDIVSLAVQLKGTEPLIIYDELGEEKQKLKRMRELDEGLQGTEYKTKQKL